MEDTLLEVRDLQVEFSTKMGIVRVLDKVNLKVDPRQTVGIIGESGCGSRLPVAGGVPVFEPAVRQTGDFPGCREAAA